MDTLQRFSNAVASVTNPIISELKGVFSSHKNVDCVFIVGPELGDNAERLKKLAQSEGLSYVVIGNGEKAVTEEMITHARKTGIIGPDTEVFCNMHGTVRRGGSGREHAVLLDKNSDPVSTQRLITLLRRPDDNEKNDSANWRGNIHLVSCHVGKLKDEIKPNANGQAGLWEQGAVFVHGGKKFVHDDTGFGDMETVVREIALSKRMDGRRPDNMEIMRALMARQAETVTLIGGDLEEPLTMHAPKSVKQIMYDDPAANWRAADAHAKLDCLRVRVSGSDKQRNALINATARSGSGEVPESLATRVLFTRLLHVKKQEKLNQIIADIKGLPGLIKLRDTAGLTPLLVYCALPRDKTLRVQRHEVAKRLVELGADVNERDKYGRMAIHFAARGGDLEMIDALISVGADFSALDGDRESLLHFLASAQSELVLPILDRLEKLNRVPDLSTRNRDGKTALELFKDLHPGNTAIHERLAKMAGSESSLQHY